MRWLRPTALVLLPALLALAAPERALAKTFVNVDGTVVTITIPIAVPDVTMRNSAGVRMPMSEYVEQAGEAVWNAALAGLRYRSCLTFVVDVDAYNAGIGAARVGDHRIGGGWPPTYRSYVFVPLTPDDSPRAQADHRGPYEYEATGNWGPDDEVTVAHELGHLMGLGDDYSDVGGSFRDVTSIPAPGREGTLMAGGDLIDQALVDRLGSLIEQDLPECWTGTMESETRRDYQGLGSCSDSWSTILRFTIDVDGTLSGDGVATLKSGPACTFPGLTGPFVTGEKFSVGGTANDTEINLTVGVEGLTAEPATGAGVVGGFHAMFIASLEGPAFVVPRTGECDASGRLPIERNDIGAAADLHTSTNQITLECAPLP